MVPCWPGGNRGGKFFPGQKCAQRQAGGDWFGDGDDVRGYAERLEGEDGAGAAEAALDFVEDQGGAMTVGEGAALAQKVGGTFVDAALAENRLEHDGASLVVNRSAQCLEIIAGHEPDVFEQRFEALAIFVLSGERHGAEGSSVIRTFERHQLALGFAAGAVSGQPGQLDRALDGLGAAVGEKCAVKTGELAEFLGQASLILVVVEIGKVDRPRGLLADDLHDAGVGVAESVDSQAGHEIQVAIAFAVVQEDALAAVEGDGIAVVGGQQETALALDNFVGVGHGK